MTIFKLWRNTADDFKRVEFGEHFFRTCPAARAALERVLQTEIGHFKAKGFARCNLETVVREVGTSEDARIVAHIKHNCGLKEELASTWYRIERIETED